MNARILKILKYGLSIGLLAWLIFQTDLSNVMGLITKADHQFILLAFVVYLFSIVVIAYRWQVLLRAHQIPLSLGRTTTLYFIGHFFNNFLPTSIGGDAIRAYSAGVDIGKQANAFASVFIERFVGLFAIVTLALTGFLVIALQLEQTV